MRERLDDCCDLRCEFAGGRKYEAAGTARGAGGATGETRGEGDGESEGLTAARTAAAEYVASRERVGEGVDLDREGAGDSGVTQRSDERTREHRDRKKMWS